VVIDADKCVGCKYCIVACPYGARYFDEEKGLPDKCDLCVDRVDAGLEPACVQTCVGRALALADLAAPTDKNAARIRSGEAKPLHPELGTKPSVYYVVGK
jgi:Fe-S-cluster-containing dehydrogenase component